MDNAKVTVLCCQRNIPPLFSFPYKWLLYFPLLFSSLFFCVPTCYCITIIILTSPSWYCATICVCIILINWTSYMDVLHIEQLLYHQRYLFSGLELHAIYNWKVIAPNMRHNLFPIRHLCVLTRISSKLQVVYTREKTFLEKLTTSIRMNL